MARLSKALKTEESESLAAAENQNESNAGDGEAHATSGDGSNNGNDMHDSASNDSIDIDMADIVVIDEYDSTKNDSKNESSSKRVRNFTLAELKTKFKIFHIVWFPELIEKVGRTRAALAGETLSFAGKSANPVPSVAELFVG